jgi:hypothetical protein
MHDVLEDHRDFFDHVSMSAEHQALIMGDTAAAIFGLE